MRRPLLIVLAAGSLAVVGTACGDSEQTGGETARSSALNQPLATPLPPGVGPKTAIEPEAGRVGEDPATEAPPEDVPVDAGVKSADDGVDLSRQRAMSVDETGSSGDIIKKATVLKGGIALPPLDAPDAVRSIIEAGNQIARTPYLWGGGHGKWLDKGYDCSGSVSYSLAAAGLLNAPLASGPFMKWGKPGKGKWVTIYTNPGHMFMVVAGVRFDTSGAKKDGSRWQNSMRSNGSFVARHPPGL